MRKSRVKQYGFMPVRPESHRYAAELEEISQILDAMPEATAWVLHDVVPAGRSLETGRLGMSAEQVLRVMILKQMKGFSYEDLHFELISSSVYQRFARIGMMDTVPSCSTLKRNVKCVKHETLQKIHLAVLEYAQKKSLKRDAKYGWIVRRWKATFMRPATRAYCGTAFEF